MLGALALALALGGLAGAASKWELEARAGERAAASAQRLARSAAREGFARGAQPSQGASGRRAEAFSDAVEPGQRSALVGPGAELAWGDAAAVGPGTAWAGEPGAPWRAAVLPARVGWLDAPFWVALSAFSAALAAMLALQWAPRSAASRARERAARAGAILAASLGREARGQGSLGAEPVDGDSELDDMEWIARWAARSEERIAAARESFDALATATESGVFVCDASGTIEPLNARFEQVAGGARSVGLLAGAAGFEELSRSFEQASLDGARLRWEGPAGTEGERRVALAMIPLERSEVRRFVGVVKDVSDKSRMEMRLAFERDKAERLMEAVNEAVFYLDAYGHVERASAGMLEILGRKISEVKGLWVGKALRLADRYDSEEAALEEVLARERVDSDRWLLESGGGQLIPVELRWRRLRWRDDSLEGVLSVRDISARVQELDRARWEATHDPLTGLLNRRAFSLAVEEMRIKMEREPASCSILMIDLDGFKQVNDEHGHEAGDAILKRVAEALCEGTEAFDFVARLGGDEFAALLQGPSKEEACGTARALRDAILGIAHATAKGIATVDASIGVAELLGDDAHGERAMRAADKSMYGVKSERKPAQPE